MFKNVKTGVKLAGGFGLVVSILVVLGVTGYVMFSRVDSNVTQMSDHSLPAVKHATGVERTAFEALIHAKNFAAYKQEESHQE